MRLSEDNFSFGRSLGFSQILAPARLRPRVDLDADGVVARRHPGRAVGAFAPVDQDNAVVHRVFFPVTVRAREVDALLRARGLATHQLAPVPSVVRGARPDHDGDCHQQLRECRLILFWREI